MEGHKKDENDTFKAYERAKLALKELAEGYVPYDSVLTSINEIKTTFPHVVGGEILNFMGNQFYWKRKADEPLILYGKNTLEDKLKNRGVIELCRFKPSKAWIGIGYFKIDWPRRKEGDQPQLLISLYLYSYNPDDFAALVGNENTKAVFMATLFLDAENTELFHELVDKRFDSLR